LKTFVRKFLLVSCLIFFGVKNAEAATITAASLTTTAGTIGLAANPLNTNQTSIAVLGVSLKAAAFNNNNVTKFTFTSTAVISPYFSNFKLYSSTNATYTAGTDPIVPSTINVVGSTITITPTTTQTINGGFGGLTVYYFLIADFTRIGGASNVTGSFSLTGLTGPGTTNGTPCVGPTYTCVPLPPPILNYATPNPTYVVTGAAITPDNLTNTGGAIVGNYSITSGTLPAGLLFNVANGQITGTPTTATAGAVAIVVSGTNASGTATTTVNITVNNAPPPILNYATPNPTYIVTGAAITPNNLTNTGGAIVGNYSITSGTLPAGLLFNAANGQITGTPTTATAGAVAITVSGTNSGGTVSTTVNITVNNAPPPILNYADANPTYIAGTAITPDDLTNTGGAVVGDYSITSGTLPAGLSFTASTGQISGTPTTATAGAVAITVSGTNSGGTVSTIVNITVNNPPVPAFTYNTPDVFVVGTVITTQNPTNTGGPVNTYSVSPGLPAGLSFNTSTGAITGNPTTVTAAADYVVTGNNPGGSSTFTINITVNPKLPALTYASPDVYTTGVAITPLNPNNTGGAVDSYAISPALPAGLSIDPVTGIISGTPTVTATIATYTVTATNITGNGSFGISITVNPPKPVITYATPQTYMVGTTISTLSATNTGGPIVSFSVAPGLPAGLSLNTVTGDITGTPTTATTAAPYVVTATNAGGTGTFSINITVLPKPPAFTYTNPATITYGSAITATTPTNSGGPATICTISPTGTGIVVSAAGVVSGTPTAAGTTTYTITPTNAGGTGPGATITVTVNQKALTVTGMTANNKVYDGTTTASFTGGTLVGVVSPDVITLVPSGTFASANVGANIVVTSTSTITGAKAANYTLTQPIGLKANITVKTLTITGLTTNNKVYDGTATATFTGGTLVGIVSPDVVTFTAAGTFPSKNIGNTLTVTGSCTLGGANAANYTLTQPALTKANITAKNLTITGLTANNKTYDGTTAATFSGGTLVGVVSPDVVTLTTTGTFATANAGTNIAVSSNSTLGGAGAGNYTLTQISGLTADINKAPLTITAVSQTRDVGINTALVISYSGFVNGDDQTNLNTQPTISTTATTASPVGTYPITVTGAIDPNYAFTYVQGILTITASGTHTYTWDWTATSNTTWENPLNWQINGVQQTTNYPGSATNKDIADIGVNVFYTSTKSPFIAAATISVTSINFGTDHAAQIGLVVNGTLTTSSDITLTVDNNIFGSALTVNLSGTGTINVPNLNLVNNETALAFENSGINSSVANLNVSGNITLTTTAFIFAGISSKFTVTGGTTTVGGQLKTSNNAVIFATTTSTFSVNPTTTATLILTNANAINLDNNTSVLDFDHAGSTVTYNGTAASQTVYTSATANASTGANYRNLTISGAGTGVPQGGTLTVNQDMLTSGNANFGTNAPTVNVAGTWTNTSNVTQGAAIITTNALTPASGLITGGAGTLTAGSMHFTGGNLTASSGTITCTGTYLNDGGTLNCGTAANASVIFKGTFTNNSGTLTANPVSTSAVFFSGSNQTLTDNSTAGTLFNNVTFNGINTAMHAGTGNFGVANTGTLTMGTGTQLTAGSGGANVGYLTLLSDAASTATVAAIPSGASIVGAVNVQRFITGGTGTRGYRLLTSPVNISGNASGGGNLSLAYLNTNASFGGTTYLGAFTEGPGTGFTYNGSFNPIIYLYDESRPSTNQGFTAGKNIGIYSIFPTTVTTLTGTTQAAATIPVGNSYLLYYVGDNHITDQTAVLTSRVPDNTSITATGYINQGNVPVKFWNTGSTNIPYDVTTGTSYPGLNQVGNPYPSTINLDVVATDNAAVNKVFWELVPGGSYVSYNASNHAVSDARASKYILSGQGFLVEAQATGETLTFKETEKVAYPSGFASPFNTAASAALLMDIKAKPNVNVNDVVASANGDVLASTDASFQVLLPPTTALTGLHLQLTKDNFNFVQTGVYFGTGNNDKFTQNEDAVSVNGSGAQVFLSSYSSDNVNVGINELGDYSTGKRVKVYVGATSSGAYNISLADIANIDTINYNVFLIDHKMNDSVDMVRNKSYAFTINNSDTSTWGANRFVLAIEHVGVPQYSLTSFKGAIFAAGIRLTWQTLNAGDYTGYILQKQDAAGNYNPLYSIQSDKGETSYSYIDQNPIIGNNIYRLAQNGINGQITYSDPLTIKYNKAALTLSGLSLYPNPSNSVVNIIYTNRANPNPSPNYTIDIFNAAGTFIKHETINTNAWTEDISSYRLGVYLLQLKDNNGQLLGQIKFIRNL